MDQKTDDWLTGMPPGTNNGIDQVPTAVEFNRWLRGMLPETNDFTAGPNRHAAGTGIDGRSLNPGLMIGEELQYQLTSTLEAQTAGMANVHNSSSMNILRAIDQLAGSSQPSKDQSNPKKLAKQYSDMKYREKRKQEMVDLKRKADQLTERNELLEDQNSSLKKDVDRMAKALKQCEKDVCQLKDKHDGLTTTVTEISKALAESKYVDVLHENEQLRYKIAVLNQINSPNTMDTIQLLVKIALLESEVSSRQLVIDALCKKMKADNYG